MRNMALLTQIFENAHSFLLEKFKMEETKKEAIVTCDKGSTCDLINESFFEPVIVASTTLLVVLPLLSHLLVTVSLVMSH
jgi:hypothetical protein